MPESEDVNVQFGDVLRVDCLQLALLNDPISVEVLRIAIDGPVLVIIAEHVPAAGGPLERVHLAIPAPVLATLAGQIDYLTEDVFNRDERDDFYRIRRATKRECG